MLAFACKRADRPRNEGRAYYSSGVLHDNLGQYQKAIKCYKKFLSVCQRIGDTHGISLSYNCIGVAYQKLAENNPDLYPIAIDYHKQHFQSSDLKGKFISSLNLGLIYDSIGNKDKAIAYSHEALGYAVKISSIVGQTAAVGALGRVGTSKTMINDGQELKQYAERYLKLSSKLNHKPATAEACIQLGRIEQNIGNYMKSIEDFGRAREIAKHVGNEKWENEASIRIGVSNAKINWENKMNDILKKANLKSDVI